MKRKLRKILSMLVIVFITAIFLGCTPEVTLTFDTRGGDPIAPSEVEQGVTIGDVLPVPTREGYTFEGWYLDAPFEEPVDLTALVLRNRTIYAKWSINEYVITFDTGEGPLMGPLTFDYNASILLPEPAEREGYTFMGWYVDDDFTSLFTRVSMPSEDLTLYARWDINEYTVTFVYPDDAEVVITVTYGGAIANVPDVPEVVGMTATWDVEDFTNITENMTVVAIFEWKYYDVTFMDDDDNIYDVQSVRHGEMADFPAETPTREGYDFTNYSVDVPDHVITEETTIYVVFIIQMFDVEFRGFDGVLLNTDTNVPYGSSATAPYVPETEGYTFTGWDKEFSEVTESMVVTAQFDANLYPFILDAGEGVFASELNIHEENVSFDSLISTPETPTLNGYVFAGWYDDDTFTTRVTFDLLMDEIGGMTLYARWTAKTYTVFFDAGYGAVDPDEKTVTFDQPYGALPTPTLDGHIFMGWFDDEQTLITAGDVHEISDDITVTAAWEIMTFTIDYFVDGVLVHSETDVEWGTVFTESDLYDIPHKDHHDDTAPDWDINLVGIPVDDDFTLSAIYVPNDYTITFDALGGTPEPEALTAPYDSSISAPLVPGKTGFSFGGWYYEDTFITPFTFNKMPGEDVTLYARWTEWPVITLDLDGGTGVTEISEEPGETISAPANPTLAGYIFEGWYDDEMLSTPYVFDIMPEEDITVYAKWSVGTAQYTVEHYEQNIDGTYPSEPTWTEVLSGTTEATVSAVQDAPYGFTFDADAANVLSGDIAGDDSLVLKVHYERNTYTVTLYYGDVLGAEETVVTSDPIVYGDTLDFLSDHPLTREGQTFVHWIDIEFDIYTAASVMEGDLDLYGIWTPDTHAVHVRHEFYIEDIVDHVRQGTFSSYRADETYIDVNVPYGTEYSPILTYARYNFVEFVYNGVTYDSIDDIVVVEGTIDEIVVRYEVKILTLAFTQNPTQADGASYTDYFAVHYDEPFDDFPVLIEPTDPDYNVVWDRTLFTAVRNHADVRAVYYDTTVKTITFSDAGSIRYIATEGLEDQIIAETSPLWNRTRTGYRFLGWYLVPFPQEGVDMPLTIEDMKFSEFATSTTIHAQWEPLPSFQQPTISDIIVEEATEQITIIWEMDPPQEDGHDPVGFDVRVNATTIFVPAGGHIDRVGATFTLTVDAEDPLHASFADLFKPGRHIVSVRAKGDLENTLDSEYSETAEFTIDVDIEGEITDIDKYDYYIIAEIGGETTWVFYTNNTYNFTDRYDFEIIQGLDYVGADGNTIQTFNTPGSFRMRLSLGGGDPVVYNGLVVSDITQFSRGYNYITYLDGVSGDDYLKDTDVDDYLVGHEQPGDTNDFYFDIRIRDNNGVRVPLSNAQLSYTFYKVENGVEELVVFDSHGDSPYLRFTGANTVSFKPAAEGLSFRVEIEPRFQALQMTVSTIEYNITINDAYNVFTNQQLKDRFSDMDVHNINIHANIKAELTPDQFWTDGYPENEHANPSTGNTYASVYGRADNATAGEHITINGNYMTIDGADLPINGGATTSTHSYAAFDVLVVDVGIFYYNVVNSQGNVIFDPNVFTDDNRVNDNHLSINNLTIIGNTTVPFVNYGLSAEEVASQEQLMMRNSGGHMGVVLRSGSASLTNMRIGFTTIPVASWAFGWLDTSETETASVAINYVHLYDSWAGSVYLHGGSGVSIQNSYLGESGGSAIHLTANRSYTEDIYHYDDAIYNPWATIDEHTVINNWSSGDEAWFRAFAMLDIAMEFKAQTQAVVYDNFGRSILKEKINPVTGLPSETFNFVLFTQTRPGAIVTDNGTTISGGEYPILIADAFERDGDTILYETFDLYRPFDFLDTDSRVQGGEFLFPVGRYSRTVDFQAGVTELMSYGVSQGDAVNMIYFAGFYNLSPAEVLALFVHGVPIDPDNPIPKYLEVVTDVAAFAGSSTIIIELVDPED